MLPLAVEVIFNQLPEGIGVGPRLLAFLREDDKSYFPPLFQNDCQYDRSCMDDA